MSKNQSNLAPTGFDYIVAVTQNSINGTLEEYLYKGLPEVVICYGYANATSNTPIPLDYPTLLKATNNTDPFSIPDGTAPSDPRVQALNNANFGFAIKAKLGLPPGVLIKNIPPILQLKPGQSSVTYTLVFSEFIATELLVSRSTQWIKQSQPSGTCWSFSGSVDLNFQDAKFTDLPVAAQKQLKDIGDANMFGVQQLYYDLNSSNLEQGFQFSDNLPPDSDLGDFMTAQFINVYWKALGGKSVLGYGAKQRTKTPPSSLAVTDLNFFTPAAVATNVSAAAAVGSVTEEQSRVAAAVAAVGASIDVALGIRRPTAPVAVASSAAPAPAPLTLNYLCATNNKTLPATTQAGFGWNWLEASEASQYHGVAALNRNTFAAIVNNAVTPHLAANCYLPSASVSLDSLSRPNFNPTMTAGQKPTQNPTPTGKTILSYSYNSPTSSDQAGLGGDIGEVDLSSSFSLTVTVEGTQMVIVQHLVVYCNLRNLQTSASGNIVDKQIIDTYSFGVDDKGQIVVSQPSANANPPTSVLLDNSQTPGANAFLNFFANVDNIVDNVANWARTCTATNLTDIPAGAVQSFVFPGGATFSFADVSFSVNQDLVAHITYASQL
jgi:hypothetical protein